MRSKSAPSLRGFKALLTVDTKDLVRNLQTGFAMLFLFATYLGVIFAIDYTFNSGSTSPLVSIQTNDDTFSERLNDQLTSRDISQKADSGKANTFIEEQDGSVVITIDAETLPPWQEVWQAVRASGIGTSDIAIVDTKGDWKVDIVRLNLGPALGVGLIAIAFVGTTVPLVAMRERGTLRLLGTTPVANAALVLSLVPIRLVVAGIEMLVILAIAIFRNYVDLDMVWRLSLSMVFSLAMLLPIAFLFAAKARNASSTQQGMAMLTLVLVGAGGGMFPPAAMPAIMQFLFNSIPTTWVMQALGADLADVSPFVDVRWLWGLMLTTGAVAFVAAIKTFSWDRERDDIKLLRQTNSVIES